MRSHDVGWQRILGSRRRLGRLGDAHVHDRLRGRVSWRSCSWSVSRPVSLAGPDRCGRVADAGERPRVAQGHPQAALRRRRDRPRGVLAASSATCSPWRGSPASQPLGRPRRAPRRRARGRGRCSLVGSSRQAASCGPADAHVSASRGEAIFQSGRDANGASIRARGQGGGMMGGGEGGGSAAAAPPATARWPRALHDAVHRPDITYCNLSDPHGHGAARRHRGPTYTDVTLRRRSPPASTPTAPSGVADAAVAAHGPSGSTCSPI